MIQLVVVVAISCFVDFSVGNVNLSYSTPIIKVGLTTKFEVQCLALGNTTAQTRAIGIYHRLDPAQNFTEIASLDIHNMSHSLVELTDIAGNLNPWELSTLTVSWVYPTSEQAGEYKCDVVFLSNHHILHETVNRTVNKEKPSFDDIIQELKKIWSSSQSECKKASESFQANLNRLLNTNFTLLDVGGKKFHLSNANNVSAMNADIICHLLGGHLAELNNTEVENVIKEINKTKIDVATILVGGSDVDGTGNWTYITSGRPVVYPAFTELGKDCLALDNSVTFKMTTVPCSKPNIVGDSKFLCEIIS